MADDKLSNTAEADQIGMWSKRFDAIHIALQLPTTPLTNATTLVTEADVILKYLLNGKSQENSNGETYVGNKK